MNCVSCGGILQQAGNRNYFRCLYCSNFHFPEETGDGVAVIGGESNFLCPVCEKQLTLGSIEGEDVCYCRNCRGFLVNNSIFGKILRDKRTRQAELRYVPVPFAAEELDRTIQCPGCRGRMDTHPYHAGGNAVIDTCHRCKLVWLDAGELSVLGKYPDRTSIPSFATVTDEEDDGDAAVFGLLGFLIRRR